MCLEVVVIRQAAAGQTRGERRPRSLPIRVTHAYYTNQRPQHDTNIFERNNQQRQQQKVRTGSCPTPDCPSIVSCTLLRRFLFSHAAATPNVPHRLHTERLSPRPVPQGAGNASADALGEVGVHPADTEGSIAKQQEGQRPRPMPVPKMIEDRQTQDAEQDEMRLPTPAKMPSAAHLVLIFRLSLHLLVMALAPHGRHKAVPPVRNDAAR
mmetsp:Transcript_6696/g.19446  ORF Transcript_6696/g.19446 Transcript_6696/m.19446 type:complete len:210 (-) Transcript_6696:297-926(-)